MLLARLALGRSVTAGELTLLAVAVVAVVGRLLLLARRHRRRKLEEMRDSALW